MDEFIKSLNQDYELVQYHIKNKEVVFHIRSSKKELVCPFCGSKSIYVHSAYQREIQDLPIQDKQVILLVDARKLFCYYPDCPPEHFIVELIDKSNDDDVVSDSDIGKFLEELKALSQDGRKEVLLEKLQKICSDIMGFQGDQKLDPYLSISEQGADSLMTFTMRSNINKLLGTELAVSVLFNYPSLDQLTDHLLEDVLNFEEEEQDEDIDDLLESINKLTG